MTVEFAQTKIIYAGNGVTTQWNIPFKFLHESDLKIYVVNVDGSYIQITQDVELDREQSRLLYPRPDSTALPLPQGKKLVILRQTPLTQEIDLQPQTNIDPKVLEGGYDKAMMIAQELNEKFSRVLTVPFWNEQTPALDEVIEDLYEMAGNVALQNENAQAAKTVAESAAETATTHSGYAAEQAALAQAWAVKTDGPVLDGEYSAKKYAQDALQGFSALVSTHNTNALAHSDIRAQLDNKISVDLSNIPPLVDYVIESADDGSGNGYRVWKSGYVEQWGRTTQTGQGDYTITFQKPFATENPFVIVSCFTSNNTNTANYLDIGYKSVSSTTLVVRAWPTMQKTWYACGQGA